MAGVRGLGGYVCWLALCLPGTALAQPQTGNLKQCLAGFGGLEWKLPYRPHLHVHGCASAGGSYGAGGDTANGRSSLELIGALRLGPVRDRAPADATYPQFQQAVFFHFDALFERHGFRRIETEEAEDAQGRYVSRARYERLEGGPQAALTWQASARNTWRVTLDPAAAR